MAGSKTKTRGLTEKAIVALVLVCLLLVVAEVVTNVSTEMNEQQNQAVVEISDIPATAVSTLTEEEYQEMIGIENAGSPTQEP